MRHHLLSALTALFLSMSVSASDQPAASAPAANAVKKFATAEDQLPGLGLMVMAIEEDRHVLMSTNGRYVIKGTVVDMWQGVNGTVRIDRDLPPAPALFDESQVLIPLSQGPAAAPHVVAFLSPSCTTCQSVVNTLSHPDFTAAFRISVVLLYRDHPERAKVAEVYCATDKTAALKALFAGEQPAADQPTECGGSQADLAVGYALARHVSALPLSAFPGFQVLGEVPLMGGTAATAPGEVKPRQP